MNSRTSAWKRLVASASSAGAIRPVHDTVYLALGGGVCQTGAAIRRQATGGDPMLKTSANYQKLAQFRLAHPLVAVPGDGFFTNKTQSELQKIVDQTLDSLKKKREIQGGTRLLRDQAQALLKAAGSKQEDVVTVRWGIHQDTAGMARGGGASTFRHFTVVDPNGGNDWHLYADAGLKTIIEMSQAVGVGVQIANV
jgi:hypothetical protein